LIYGGYAQDELDRQYDAASTVPSLQPFLERWSADSARTRAELDNETAAYGEHERERLELFPAARAGAPLFVFIHGGYWRRLDASYFSFVAGPVVRAGGACALFTYPLAPASSLDAIVAAVRRGFTWLGTHAERRLNASPQRIVVGGHSAGGQLAGMLAATDWAAHGLDPHSVGGVFGLSGLYDLEPVRRANVNEWLRLPDAAAAERNSPQSHPPHAPVPVIAAAGQCESDEFRRQSQAYARACAAAGCNATYLEPAGHNHYTIVEQLGDPATELSALLLGLLGLA
jgi:arylformamidase